MSKVRTLVWITTSFEGIHYWENAPSDVDFLRSPHRHIFHVKLGVEVKHDDRDVEFILLKRQVSDFIRLNASDFNGKVSCEMMARTLMSEFDAVFVEVSEDGENGARLEVVDET